MPDKPRERTIGSSPSCMDLQASRPRLRDGVGVAVVKDRNGKPWFRVSLPVESAGRDAFAGRRERFLRVGVVEYRLLSHLDGSRTVEQARMASVANEDAGLSPQQAESLVLWAGREGLFDGVSVGSNSSWSDGGLSRQSATWLRLPLLHGGEWLQPWAATFGAFFSRTGLVLSTAIMMLAAYIAIGNLDRLAVDLRSTWTPWGWFRLALAWCLLKVLHEAAHAICCTRFGGRVGEIGIAWMVVAPVAYVDVTGAYRIRSRTQRMAIALAGIYIEMVVASLGILLWSQTTSAATGTFLCTVAATATVGSLLFNLNPLMRLDGYYALTDWLNRPNLAGDAQAAFRGAVRWLFLGMRSSVLSDASRGLLLFGIAAFAYRIVVVGGLALAALQMYGPSGLVVAAVVVFTLWVRPALKIASDSLQTLRNRPASALRAAIVLLGMVGASLSLGWWLNRGHDSFAGVLEFVDETPVRTATAGFVRVAKVHDGQTVHTGDVLMELENEALAVQLASAKLELQTVLSRGRHHLQQHDSAQAIAHQRAADVLKQRVDDLEKQTRSLIVVAPRSGVVLAPDIADSVGSWLPDGTPIGLVVRPCEMKAIIAIPQSQLAEWRVRASGPFVVDVAGRQYPADLMLASQSTLTVSPHPALSASAGGPLPVRADATGTSAELLEPCLKVELAIRGLAEPLPAGVPARLMR